jgi:hypothetical protein
MAEIAARATGTSALSTAMILDPPGILLIHQLVTMDTMLESTIICPKCGQKETVQMPTSFCMHFYECAGCKALLKALPGDCCVFCSYGTHTCPPKSAELHIS